MEEIYEGHGIRFRYPVYWEVTEQEDDEATSITVASPDTSFWSISLFHDAPSPQEVLESALEAFREEYAEADVYSSTERIGDRAGVARDLDFVCFELINSAFLRSFQTERYTVSGALSGIRRRTRDDAADARGDFRQPGFRRRRRALNSVRAQAQRRVFGPERPVGFARSPASRI